MCDAGGVLLIDLPWAKPGRFHKGNLHTHSTRSDCTKSPAAVMAVYRDAGYDFISLTDHFLDRYGFPIVDTREFRDAGFTTLIGAELHAGTFAVGERWHILAVGLPLDFAQPTPTEDGPGIAACAIAAGAWVGIAHPAWYDLNVADAQTLVGAHAVEIWNETCYWLNGRGDSNEIYDLMLASGQRINCYAADDAHFKERPDDRAAWVQVRATANDPAALLAALKAGDYYSSTGPTIEDVRCDGECIHVRCSPSEAIFVSGRGAKYEAVYGPNCTRASLPIAKFAGAYCRVTVMDAARRRAWTNPIWFS